MSRIQKMIFEAVEAAEAGLKHSNVEGTQYRRKERQYVPNGQYLTKKTK